MKQSEDSHKQTPNLRRFTRFQVQFQASFQSPLLVAGHGRLIDLSLRGCRISSSTPVPNGTGLEMTVHLPDHDSPVQIESAGVRWANEGEFGVEFIRMQPEAQQRLSLFVTSLEETTGH